MYKLVDTRFIFASVLCPFFCWFWSLESIYTKSHLPVPGSVTEKIYTTNATFIPVSVLANTGTAIAMLLLLNYQNRNDRMYGIYFMKIVVVTIASDETKTYSAYSVLHTACPHDVSSELAGPKKLVIVVIAHTGMFNAAL